MCEEIGVHHFSRKGVEQWNQPSGSFKAKTKHGKLTVRIDENQQTSQPAPFSQGQTKTEEHSTVGVDEEKHPMFLLEPGPRLANEARQ